MSTNAKRIAGEMSWQEQMRAKQARRTKTILTLRMKLTTAILQGDKVAEFMLRADLEALGAKVSN